MNSPGKTNIYRPVPPTENGKSYDISLDEQSQIDRIAGKVDWIVSTLLAKAIEKKDVPVFEWGAGGFKSYES